MNGHSDIDTKEATQHLKNILNLGKSESDADRKSITNGDMEASGDLCVGGGFGIKNSYPSLFKGPEDQQLILPGNEDETSISIFGQDVTVYSSPLHHGSGRSKIKIESVVDYGWEQKYYLGKLVSVHISGMYVAYAIRAPQSPHGYVRVMKRDPNIRALLKGPKGEVKDLAFSHSSSPILLGFVDQVGDLYVHEVRDKGDKILCNRLVHVVRYPEPKPSDNHRIIWCPYIPDDVDSMDDLGDSPNSDDVASLLVVTHDEKAEIWNVNLLAKEYGTDVDIPSDKVKAGLQIISEHKLPISTATFSPDGTALATASFDGDVKFFQVNMDIEGCESSPRCLHQWRPHDGKPVSMMFFLDNHKNHNPDVQFWKFAITGADNNQEIKLWTCETWCCLQTIRFLPSREDNTQPCLKADLDLSSQYLFLSDINREVMYILQILQEPSISKAKICSLAEFSLSYPVLSLAIADVSKCKFKPLSPVTADSENREKDSEAEEEPNCPEKLEGCLVKLFWIHTKSLQSCRIVYRPVEGFPFHSAESISSLSQDSFVYRDRLSDIHIDTQESKSESENDLSAEKGASASNPVTTLSPSSASLSSTVLSSVSSHISPYKTCDDILLTPEDFTSPSHTTVASANLNNSYKLPVVEETPRLPTHEKVSEADSIPSIPADTGVVPRRKSSQHSSTSSPSREVAEILDHSKLLNCEDHDVIRIVKVKKEPAALDSLSNDNLLKKNDAMQEAADICRNQSEFPTGEWPQAPDPHKEYRIASRNDGDMNIQLSPREHLAPSRHSCKREESSHGSETASPDVFNSETKCVLANLTGSVERLSQQVNSIGDILHSQRQEMQQVQNEIQALHETQKHIQNSLQSVDYLDNTVAIQVERIVGAHAVLSHERLDAVVSQKEEAGQQLLDQQVTALSQNVVSSVNSKIDKCVKNEMKNAVIPQITKHMDSLKEQLQADVHSRLNTVDNSLRDSINKHIKSKAFNDAISQAVINQLQPQILSACKEVFQSSILPSIEKLCHALFIQLNESFQRGLIEFVQHVEMHRQMTLSNIDVAVKKTQEQMKELISNSQTFCDRSIEKMQEHQLESQKYREVLVETLRQCVQEEVHRAFAEQPQSLAAMRSQTVTPVPQQDRQVTQQHIMNLVKQGHLNEAFQQALSAADLPLVIALCESVSLDEVFGGSTCPLQQHVLLSLIHQLSGDLQVKTELKVRYIEDAITSLDSNSPITKGHISKVVGSLQQRISIFLQHNPNHKLARNLRRIHLALQSMIN